MQQEQPVETISAAFLTYIVQFNFVLQNTAELL